ncbi:MAG: S1C family serine protease [Balneolaceae bacterium]
MIIENKLSTIVLGAAFFALLLTGCNPGEQPAATAGESVEDMLDRVLGSVVTVAVEETGVGDMLLGFRGNNASTAYESGLDLGSALSSGSGYIIERDGQKYVITNSHVIESASGEPGSLVVYSINRSRYEVDVVGGDTFYDFAVLAFVDEPGDEISVVDHKKEDPRIGEPVWAIGNPLGDYPYTVSEGIIGALNRARGGMTGKFGFLQSTATVIWGNSGGPLFDRNGNVAGINSQITFARQGEQLFIQPQINFALEAAISERLTDDILTNEGRVRRAFIGVELSDVIQRTGDFGITRWNRAHSHPVITSLIRGTPAREALAGHQNSKVLEINGTATRNIEEALGVFEKTRPGDMLKFKLERQNGSVETVEFATEELNPERNIKIADRLMQFNTSDMSVREMPGERKVMLGYVGTDWDVAGAGVQADDGLSVWRVETRNDLAAAARFAAMYGYVDIFVSQPGQNIQRLRLNLSGRNDRVHLVLWY